MTKDFLELLYGTDSREEVLKKKTTEKQVRAFASGLEGTIQVSEEECRKLCKACNNFEYLSGYENRIKQYTVTDETVDRYGDIVRAKGASFANYKRNPVIQFAHDYSLPPIGISIKTWYDKASNTIKSFALFFDDRVDNTGRSDLIFRFVSSNAMRACSIGFSPIEYNDPEKEEREKLGMGKYGVEYTKWDMLEFSPVPVPANPNALQDEYRDAYLKSVETNLRSGLFTGKDVEVLKKSPLFSGDVLDSFVKELGNASVIVDKDITEVSASVLPPVVQPVINLNLDISQISKQLTDLQTKIDTMQVAIDKSISDVNSIAKRLAQAAGKSVDDKILYDIMGIPKPLK